MIDPLDPMNRFTLKAAREARGLSAVELAAHAGTTSSTIWRIETGAVDPRLDETWIPIVAALRGIALIDVSEAA